MIAILTILKDLIAIDSTNPPGNCAGITEYIARFLKNHLFVQVECQETQNGNKNIIAIFGKPRLFLNAHLDTVPFSSAQTENSNAFYERDMKLFGRGTADVKGAISAILYALQFVQPKNFLLLFNPDEEHGNNIGICTFLHSSYSKGLQCGIVTEPTQCHVVMFHNGICNMQINFIGKSAHACAPDEGINAIEIAAEFMHKLKQYKETLSHQIFLGLKPSINIAVIHGGTKPNMVPDSCMLMLSYRYLPDESSEHVVSKIKKLVDQPTTTVKVIYSAPPLNCGIKDTFLVEAFKSCGIDSNINTAHFWSEASLFSQAGIPSIVFGPGNIEQAHSHEEFIDKHELLKSTEIYKNLFSQF